METTCLECRYRYVELIIRRRPIAFRAAGRAREESGDFHEQVNGNIIIAVGRYSL